MILTIMLACALPFDLIAVLRASCSDLNPSDLDIDTIWLCHPYPPTASCVRLHAPTRQTWSSKRTPSTCPAAATPHWERGLGDGLKNTPLRIIQKIIPPDNKYPPAPRGSSGGGLFYVFSIKFQSNSMSPGHESMLLDLEKLFLLSDSMENLKVYIKLKFQNPKNKQKHIRTLFGEQFEISSLYLKPYVGRKK